jgi:hypothetical protein
MTKEKFDLNNKLVKLIESGHPDSPDCAKTLLSNIVFGEEEYGFIRKGYDEDKIGSLTSDFAVAVSKYIINLEREVESLKKEKHNKSVRAVKARVSPLVKVVCPSCKNVINLMDPKDTNDHFHGNDPGGYMLDEFGLLSVWFDKKQRDGFTVSGVVCSCCKMKFDVDGVYGI